MNSSKKIRKSQIESFTQSDIVNSLGFSPENVSNKNQPNGYPSLDSEGKILVSQLPNSIVEYKGVYNATSNTPTLMNGVGNIGDSYRVSVAGSGVNSLEFVVGDYVIYNGTQWEKSHSGNDNVLSVFGRTGNITSQSGDYDTSQVTESTDKNYQTDNQKSFNDATSSIQTQLNGKESSSNKAINFDTINDNLYPTIKAVNDRKLDKVIVLSNVTLLSTNWVASGDIYEYEYEAEEFTANSIADVIPSISSMEIIKVAGIYPIVNSYLGSMKVYSKTVPSGNIEVTVNILNN